MSNYPAGSMMGSGIYSYDYEEDRACQECEFSGVVLVYVDDWSTHTWECPLCEHAHEIDLDAENPDNEHDADRYF